MLVGFPNDGRNANKGGPLGSAPSALTRDELEESVVERTDHNGLNQAVFTNGIGELVQAIFVEACVGRGTGPSRSSGSLKLSWRGGSAELPVEVRVRAFDLPATPALTTAFGFSGYSAAKGHRRGVEVAGELTRAYGLAALRRGITLFGGTQDPPSFSKDGDEVRIDWTSYDAEVGPFLDGQALPGGARWTSVELREPGKLTRAQRRSYRRQWQEHFRQRGWLDRLFRYVEDEPSPDAFPRVSPRVVPSRSASDIA